MIICALRTHCVACRTNSGFREQLVKGGLAKEVEFACPYGVTAEAALKASDLGVLVKFTDLRSEQGRKAWRVLGLAALAGTVTSEWLATTFRSMIPSFGCACLRGWDEILLRIPFRPDDQFAWSVEVHNQVNQKILKPKITLEEAKLIWGVS
jgi:hypothetical protein